MKHLKNSTQQAYVHREQLTDALFPTNLHAEIFTTVPPKFLMAPPYYQKNNNNEAIV
jgi:hypothetical protein